MHHVRQRDDVEDRQAQPLLDRLRERHQVRALDDQRAQVRIGPGPARPPPAAPPAPAGRRPARPAGLPASPRGTRADPACRRSPTGTSWAPIAARCRAVSAVCLATSRPTFCCGSSIRCTIGSWIRLEANTGTDTAAASSAWNSTRNPQPEVIAAAPRACRSRRGLAERFDQPRIALGHHPLGGGALDHLVEHREVEGARVADVAGDLGEDGLQAEHPDRRRSIADAGSAAGRPSRSGRPVPVRPGTARRPSRSACRPATGPPAGRPPGPAPSRCGRGRPRRSGCASRPARPSSGRLSGVHGRSPVQTCDRPVTGHRRQVLAHRPPQPVDPAPGDRAVGAGQRQVAGEPQPVAERADRHRALDQDAPAAAGRSAGRVTVTA